MKPSTFISIYNPIEEGYVKYPRLGRALDWYESLWYNDIDETVRSLEAQFGSNNAVDIKVEKDGVIVYEKRSTNK